MGDRERAKINNRQRMKKLTILIAMLMVTSAWADDPKEEQIQYSPISLKCSPLNDVQYGLYELPTEHNYFFIEGGFIDSEGGLDKKSEIYFYYLATGFKKMMKSYKFKFSTISTSLTKIELSSSEFFHSWSKYPPKLVQEGNNRIYTRDMPWHQLGIHSLTIDRISLIARLQYHESGYGLSNEEQKPWFLDAKCGLVKNGTAQAFLENMGQLETEALEKSREKINNERKI